MAITDKTYEFRHELLMYEEVDTWLNNQREDGHVDVVSILNVGADMIEDYDVFVVVKISHL